MPCALGQICGKVAAKAASSGNASRKALSPYAKQWNREFYWEYRMGRASLETLRRMGDPEIDALTKGLKGKNLDFKGSLARKGIPASRALTSAQPRTIFSFMKNLFEG